MTADDLSVEEANARAARFYGYLQRAERERDAAVGELDALKGRVSALEASAPKAPAASARAQLEQLVADHGGPDALMAEMIQERTQPAEVATADPALRGQFEAMRRDWFKPAKSAVRQTVDALIERAGGPDAFQDAIRRENHANGVRR